MKLPAKNIVLLLIAVFVLAVGWFISMKHLDFKTVQRLTLEIRSTAVSHGIISFAALLLLHTIGMFFTLPTKAILNMAGAALLGFLPGAVVTLAGTLIGTSALFFTAQKLVQGDVLEKLPPLLQRFEKRLLNHPMLTVASLRMILVLPYGAITIFCAITRIPFRGFLWGSFIGDIPVILLYSTAGLKLIELAEQRDAISIETIVILSIAGIGLFAGSLLPRKRNPAANF